MSRSPLLREVVDALDAVPCGLVSTTSGGTILRANKTFCEWIGKSSEALAGKVRFQDLLTMGGRIFHQTHWAPLLQMQGSIAEVKLEVVHADGTTVPIVLNAIVREASDEADEGLIEIAGFVARDRDAYERELLQSRKRLEASVAEATRLGNEAKDRALLAEQMIGIVSHDLRNPLTSILVGTSLLERGELAPKHASVVTRMRRSADRAKLLIADLLDFTQARLGRALAVTLAPIDLHAIADDAVDELSHVHPSRALRRVREGSGACSGDGNRLAQLIGNLVSNAVAYGAPDEPVTVTTRVDEATFSIEVHNQGAPIPPALQSTIFEPMSRGTSGGSAARSVGLGLFIVREIARAHAGSAEVTSTEAGTTFTATFPRG